MSYITPYTRLIQFHTLSISISINKKIKTKGDFLEIAALRRILLSGVSCTRHVLGLVHPVSIFTTKNFDGIFWYERHSSGVHQYDFKHLIDVSF